MESMINYIEHYGYIVLFLALMIELIALPIPGQTLMSYVGYLVSQGQLHWGLSILIATIGSSTGMTVSYWIGYKLGTPFFQKYGHRFYMGEEKLEKVSRWFQKYGNNMLMIGYFIPGVRHFTGYFSGITRLPFRIFAIYTYGGALIWTTTFITIGKFLGDQWSVLYIYLKKYYVISSIILAVALIGYYLYRKKAKKYKRMRMK
ncbi:DedA family protein [Bacillus chungangensis]|uniref:Membrane protein DedA with SNARE-associated domain n=1 Tax=Bacillus chungangensis TaxID=587633 RepID=A0ABT9WTX6_9BACI|nr:DedA family protein [Bacillus chungangensis]MDQ0176756.1 membrane protein DedA with SNARE-associated domain [Bacillus chungangensis]